MTAALLALASALAYAVSTVVGHRAATTLSGPGSVWSRAAGLLRHPGFLAGQLTGALGLGLHAAALAGGLVVVVQPVLCVGLVLALGLGATVDRHHPGRPLPTLRQWCAAGLVVVGLVVFLISAAPTAGTATAMSRALPAAVGTFLLVSGAVLVVVRSGRLHRPATALGACAGAAFGLTGVLLKTVTAMPVASWATSRSVYALLGVGLAGAAFAQWAYSAGPLVQSQPIASALEPVIAVALAGPVFAEGLAGGTAAHLAQVMGLAVLVAGVAGVARAQPTPITPAPEGAAPLAAGAAPRRSSRSGSRQLRSPTITAAR